MPKAPLLSDEQIAERLIASPDWKLEGDRLVRTFAFADFASAVGFVQELVGPSDEQNHHPDVSVHWNEVTLSLWTHASGGVTGRDLALAATIDRIADAKA